MNKVTKKEDGMSAEKSVIINIIKNDKFETITLNKFKTVGSVQDRDNTYLAFSTTDDVIYTVDSKYVHSYAIFPTPVPDETEEVSDDV